MLVLKNRSHIPNVLRCNVARGCAKPKLWGVYIGIANIAGVVVKDVVHIVGGEAHPVPTNEVSDIHHMFDKPLWRRICFFIQKDAYACWAYNTPCGCNCLECLIRHIALEWEAMIGFVAIAAASIAAWFEEWETSTTILAA